MSPPNRPSESKRNEFSPFSPEPRLIIQLRRHPFLAYLATVFLVVLVTLIQYLLGRSIVHAVFLLYYPVVILVSWYLSLGPALLAIFLSIVCVNFLFFDPRYQFTLQNLSASIPLIIFSLISLLVSWISHKARMAEEARRASEERARFFSDALQYSSQPFASGYPNGRFLRFNQAYLDLVGFTEEELLTGISWKDHLTPPEWREHEAKALEKLRETGIPQVYEKVYLRQDGRRIPVELKVHLNRNKDGSPAFYYAYVTDISGHKKIQQELRLHQELLETIVKRLPVAVNLMSGQDFRVKLTNPTYQNFASGKEMMDRKMSEIWPEVWPWIEPCFKRVLITGEPYYVQDDPLKIRRTPEGPLEKAYFTWSLSRVQLPGDTGWGILNTAWETTDRKKTELALKESEQLLKEAVKMRDEFLSIASHELKTPLTTLKLQIQNQLRMVERAEVGNLPVDKLRNSSTMVSKQLDRLTTLIDDLLDVSRISAGKLKLNLEPTDLTELVNLILEQYKDSLASAGMPLSAEVQKDVCLSIDQLRIEQVLSNLITNAIKYAPGKPLGIRLSVREKQARVEIQDHGPGIEKKDQGLIFERFERAMQERALIAGLGLGLYISKQIIRAHEGKIWVESLPGCGSTFIFEIPLTQSCSQ